MEAQVHLVARLADLADLVATLAGTNAGAKGMWLSSRGRGSRGFGEGPDFLGRSGVSGGAPTSRVQVLGLAGVGSGSLSSSWTPSAGASGERFGFTSFS